MTAVGTVRKKLHPALTIDRRSRHGFPSTDINHTDQVICTSGKVMLNFANKIYYSFLRLFLRWREIFPPATWIDFGTVFYDYHFFCQD
jgi:hypothetical protein